MTPIASVVLILMPLKLLQAEQSQMINWIPNSKALVLNGENNYKHIHKQVARGDYTYIFTSPEIVLLKKFNKNILDDTKFTRRLCLLAVDEIHLVDQWDQAFCSLYAKIEKVWKKIPCYIPLLGISTTLTKQAQVCIFDKVEFKSDYRLMQTSLDRPEIMQIYKFMEYAKASCLDLQFILPKKATAAKNIQKTIIFVNSVSDICPLIRIIVS